MAERMDGETMTEFLSHASTLALALTTTVVARLDELARLAPCDAEIFTPVNVDAHDIMTAGKGSNAVSRDDLTRARSSSSGFRPRARATATAGDCVHRY